MVGGLRHPTLFCSDPLLCQRDGMSGGGGRRERPKRIVNERKSPSQHGGAGPVVSGDGQAAPHPRKDARGSALSGL
ncbi:hypothetical protein LY76DRAFT_593522 [Colletotrichum caudatum]|nr:hypothetical protein LY76DRAFT_593522 [Colletotrichum caudatum]